MPERRHHREHHRHRRELAHVPATEEEEPPGETPAVVPGRVEAAEAAELLGERAGGRRAVRRVRREGAHHDLAEPLRHLRRERRRGRVLAALAARVRRRPGEEEVERAPEAVDVGRLGRRALVAPLLRRHVRDRPDRRGGRRARRERGGEAEVREHHAPRLGGDEDVLGLQVPVHDAGAVGGVDRAREVLDEPGRLPGGERVALGVERPADPDQPGLASSGSAQTAIST